MAIEHCCVLLIIFVSSSSFCLLVASSVVIWAAFPLFRRFVCVSIARLGCYVSVGSQTCERWSRRGNEVRCWAVCSDNEGRTRWTSVTAGLVMRDKHAHTCALKHAPATRTRAQTAAACPTWQQFSHFAQQVCDMFNERWIMNIISHSQTLYYARGWWFLGDTCMRASWKHGNGCGLAHRHTNEEAVVAPNECEEFDESFTFQLFCFNLHICLHQ